VYVYFSNYEELSDFANYYRKPWLELHMVTNYKTSTFWNQHLLFCKADALIYLNDDILMCDDTLIKISDFLEKEGTDCLLGLHQKNIISSTKVRAAFGVIGKKYAERFPNKAVWPPQYYRFYGDKEIELFAESINKFFYDPSIAIIHLHPCSDYKQIDMTHVKVREYLKQDRGMFYERQKQGYLWGKNFDLIKE
jgi:hypothetical protein